MGSTLIEARDLSFLLYEWLHIETLTRHPRFAAHDRTTFDHVLATAREVAEDHFQPHAAKSDASDPSFDGTRVHLIPEISSALAHYVACGFLAASVPEEEGGMGLPHVVEAACGALFAADCARLVDDRAIAENAARREALDLLLDVLTPIAKAWPSEWCLQANALAIQVLGGYGYTRDYPVERLYRDNRLNPIHEGTNGVQAIDLRTSSPRSGAMPISCGRSTTRR